MLFGANACYIGAVITLKYQQLLRINYVLICSLLLKLLFGNCNDSSDFCIGCG